MMIYKPDDQMYPQYKNIILSLDYEQITSFIIRHVAPPFFRQAHSGLLNFHQSLTLQRSFKVPSLWSDEASSDSFSLTLFFYLKALVGNLFCVLFFLSFIRNRIHLRVGQVLRDPNCFWGV